MTADRQKFRIAFIAHSQSLCNCARRYLEQETDCEVSYQVAGWGEEVPAARKYFSRGVEAILSYGGSAQALTGHFRHSIAVAERGDMDFIKRLLEIRERSSRAIVCSVYREERDVAAMQQLLGMDLCSVNWATMDELTEKIGAAFAQGYRHLVGGGLGAQRIRELGGEGIILEPSAASFRQAVANARAMALQKREEQARSAGLAGILKQLDEGMLCIDGNSEIIHWNPNAFRMLRLSPASGPEALAPFIDTFQLRDVLRDGRTRNEMIIRHRDEQYLVSSFPLSAPSAGQGAVALFRDIASFQKIRRKISAELYEKGLTPRYTLADIKGVSPAVQALVQKIRRFAKTDASVHISGETGTGKELAAHALHAASGRKSRPFVAVNCSALAESLLESELFGYDEGAFTGARRGGKAGLFELANRGSIFLDEIGSISPAMQMRLLRVLEAREIIRVGGDRVLPVDVRVISASNEPLESLVRAGAFRRDLYYRLKVLHLAVPPLRQRAGDIPPLLEGVLRRYGKTPAALSPVMLQAMAAHDWPGNIRELLSLMETYLVLLDGSGPDEALFLELLREQAGSVGPAVPAAPALPPATEPRIRRQVGEMKRAVIRAAVEAQGGNRHAAARALGVSYNTVWRALRVKD